MNFKASWEITKNWTYKHYGQNSGNMILHAGAAGWLLSSVAQVVALVFNDNIPKEQKKFLVPQEIADGFVNVLSFYLITKGFKDVGQKLVKSGKWSNLEIRNFVKKNDKTVKMGDFSTDIESKFKGNEEFHSAFGPFKTGVDMLTTTIGSVISCNIITPYARNYIGAILQKRSIDNDKAQQKLDISLIPAPPVLPAQNSFKTNNYKSPIINPPSGSMRI